MKKFIMSLMLICVLTFQISAADSRINLAIFEFEITDQILQQYKGKISELLTMKLSENSDLKIIERQKLNNIIDEMELGKAGFVNNDDAAQIGRLAGANAILLGKMFVIDDEITLTARIININTSEVYSNIARGSVKKKINDLIDDLNIKISATLQKEKKSIISQPLKKTDIIETLKNKLGDKTRPTVAVIIPERHIGEEAIDPAAETELNYLLLQTGFKITDVSDLSLREWATAYYNNTKQIAHAKLKNTDIIIVGEAFSEFGMRKNNLVVCKGRIEIKAINLKTSEIIFVDRITETGIDISAQIAAKSALQNGMAKLSERLIPAIAK